MLRLCELHWEPSTITSLHLWAVHPVVAKCAAEVLWIFWKQTVCSCFGLTEKTFSKMNTSFFRLCLSSSSSSPLSYLKLQVWADVMLYGAASIYVPALTDGESAKGNSTSQRLNDRLRCNKGSVLHILLQSSVMLSDVVIWAWLCCVEVGQVGVFL